jgi:transposase InsO family protein
VVGRETKVDTRGLDEAHQQQSCAGEQHLRQGQLADHEGVLPPAPPAAAGDALTDLRQVARRRSRRLQRRSETEDQRGEDRHQQREAEHGCVDADLVQARQVRRRHRNERAHARKGEGKAGDAPRHRERQRFDQQLPDDAAAIGAHGDAQGKLHLPPGGLPE